MTFKPYTPSATPRRGFRWLKWLAMVVMGAAILTVLAIGVTRLTNAIRTRIAGPAGVQESIYVNAGGIRQYLQIRGQNAANPVILSVHGGPGNPMTALSYAYQTALESSYTIVQWEQRGSGRTYYENRGYPALPLSGELVLKDMDEVVDYLRTRFGREKIIVMGHSWGTVLGSLYAQAHPEKVSAFVSVSQVVDMREAVILAGTTALSKAAGQSEADAAELTELVAELTAMQGYDQGFNDRFVRTLGFAGRYMPYAGQRKPSDTIWPGVTSPDLSLRDLRWFWLTSFNSQEHARLEEPLLRACYEFDAFADAEYEVPVFFIAGMCDWVTPFPMIERYYDAVTAPDKVLVPLEGLGHSPQLESPTRFCAAVQRMLSRIPQT